MPAPAPLHLLADFPSAQCLDGSPGAYYHRPALNDSYASKWVFSLQGGGECVEESTCYGRARDKTNTSLGSSTGYAADGSSFMEQFQNGYDKYNPDFYTWNHVFIMYCTGDLHLGTVESPGPEQWHWAQFSGALIVDAVLQDLHARADLRAGASPGAAYNLDQADLVIWSGDSAGGIGSAAHLDGAADTIRAMSSSPSPSTDVRVVGAPIAGFYW